MDLNTNESSFVSYLGKEKWLVDSYLPAAKEEKKKKLLK